MPRAYGLTNAAPYASAPAVGAAGDTYWNTATKVLYVSDGTAWVPTPPGGAAGGDLTGSTYPNPTITAGAVTRAKLAPGASVSTPAPLIDLAANVTLTQTDAVILEQTYTVTANRPLLVIGFLVGMQQLLIASAQNNECYITLRRGGTVGAANGTVIGITQQHQFTATTQFDKGPFAGTCFDCYVPAADGTVRYSMTSSQLLVTTTISAKILQGRLLALPFA